MSVCRRGAGLASEDVPRLCKRYGRTASGRRQADGLGLGLYITRRLVESLGGTIWVEGRPGEGSTLSFSQGRAG